MNQFRSSFKRNKKVPEPTPKNTDTVKKGNLDDILEGLKSKKITTIEKTKLDWEEYKKQNNLSDELAYHNKDGYEYFINCILLFYTTDINNDISYLEKMAFKQRTEERVHALQKNCRTQNLKK